MYLSNEIVLVEVSIRLICHFHAGSMLYFVLLVQIFNLHLLDMKHMDHQINSINVLFPLLKTNETEGLTKLSIFAKVAHNNSQPRREIVDVSPTILHT